MMFKLRKKLFIIKNFSPQFWSDKGFKCTVVNRASRVAVVHLNFRAGSTFPVPVFTVSSSMDRTSRCNKVDAVRLYRLNLLLLKGKRCVALPSWLKITLSPFKLFHSPLVCDDHDEEDGQRHGDVVERIEHLDTERSINLWNR